MVNLKSLIEKIQSTPISVKYLRERLPERTDIVEYTQLKNKHRSAVFKGLDGLIVIIPKKGSKQGHFIVLLPKRNHIEYFSSLGGNPFTELSKLNEPTQIFKNLLGNNYIYNRNKLQKQDYTVQDCAAWCILRLKFHKLKLREFVQLFQASVNLQTSDEICSMLALPLLL